MASKSDSDAAKGKVDENDDGLDYVIQEIGEFGRFQIINYILIFIPIALSTTWLLSFIFTAATLEYRYKIHIHLTLHGNTNLVQTD